MEKCFFNEAAECEIDTIRIWFKVNLDHCALDAWFDREFLKEISLLEAMKNPDGSILRIDGKNEVYPTWDKKRLDHRFSSFSKMQVFQDWIIWGKKPNVRRHPVISIEFSVPKYYHFTNGINRGVSAVGGGVDDFLLPCFAALDALHLFEYWYEPKEDALKFLRENYEIRRLDLSYNFYVKDVKFALSLLRSVKLPKKPGEVEPAEPLTKDDVMNGEERGDYSSVTFGGHAGSSYKMIFYDKAAEQKKLFSTFDKDLTSPQREQKKIWYQENKSKFENILRFEIQFHNRFFKYHYPESRVKRGDNMAKKIIDLCADYYKNMLKEFDKQLGILSTHTENEYTMSGDCLNQISEKEMLGELSRTQAANLRDFVCQCHKFGADTIKTTMSKQLFSLKRRKVLLLTGYDVNIVCTKCLPIMRNMSTLDADFLQKEQFFTSWLDKGIQELYFDIPKYAI